MTFSALLDDFADAPPGRRDAAFHRLAAALWDDGAPTALAAASVPSLIGALDRVDDARRGHLLVLLGLLAEAEYPAADGPVATAVAAGVDRYLELFASVPADRPVSFALRYLLAHFPADRDRILEAARGAGLDRDDLSRLDRALASLDPDAPSLGRVFPSPAVWTLDDDEREFDDRWIKSLTPAQVVENWRKDTRTVLGGLGAKAYWSVRRDRAPAPLVTAMPERDAVPAPAEGGAELFEPHAGAFRCPACGGGLEFDARGARCGRCDAEYTVARGVLDLTAATDAGADRDDFQFKLAEMPTMGLFYEAHARPNFLRISGSNWDGAITPRFEDGYIADHVRPVDGPVLDLAAGAGRWTATLARAVGPERVVALDPNPPMLSVLRGVLPEVPAVMAGAAALPFGDATLGAVLCWNALQAFPDDAAAAIAEVGRCLRPGGTFTLMTFRMSPDPVYRHFQRSHHFPQHTGGLRLFEPPDLRRWIAGAGMAVREESSHGTFVFITAERTADAPGATAGGAR